jgi:hypothetical protein
MTNREEMQPGQVTLSARTTAECRRDKIFILPLHTFARSHSTTGCSLPVIVLVGHSPTATGSDGRALSLRVPTVSDDPAPTCLGDTWSDLTDNGYAITSDEALGLPEKFRTNFGQTYFNDHVLEDDPGGKPAGRKRARDVIRYQWHDDDLHVQEHEKITITDRDGRRGKREHARVEFLKDPQAEELIRALLGLVPPAQRQPDGTFGVNLFRTVKDVVTSPHHDDEKYCVIYVLDRVGGGAETYLYHPDDVTEEGKPTAEPVLRRQLNPGEIIIFEDERFKHSATQLETRPDGTARRDVVVCTVDHPETYLSNA